MKILSTNEDLCRLCTFTYEITNHIIFHYFLEQNNQLVKPLIMHSSFFRLSLLVVARLDPQEISLKDMKRSLYEIIWLIWQTMNKSSYHKVSTQIGNMLFDLSFSGQQVGFILLRMSLVTRVWICWEIRNVFLHRIQEVDFYSSSISLFPLLYRLSRRV